MADPSLTPDAKTNGRRDMTHDLSDEELDIMFREQVGMHALIQDNLEHGLEAARVWG